MDYSEDDSDDNSNTDGGIHEKAQNRSSAGRRKRKRRLIAFSEHCENEFDVTDNTEDACVWHPGNFAATLV